ncbi:MULTISPECIES: acylphosphatase [Methanothrix]|jgi:acylphosphatase|uniref:acylphosphatase n=2 Tax=Methanotrichaceae TaxID=143067 RepID=UPI0023533C09|nr:acylphosphatase [Methanothrix soehngenii]HOE46730.1 acylphosphatase [Methanothrix soehngenii]HPL21824.1 acylphosphatase [Methanothrix soehngenii]HRD16823.1 acylphosphatase [Methanothrix soehngenii]
MTMRLTAFVSGRVQEVGYRARVIDMAIALGLKGMVVNLKDGRVKIVAEGEGEKLKWFESAMDIKNALIHVSSIEKNYSSASGEFDQFGKLVAKGETDTRLDTAAVYLKKLLFAVNNMNDNLGGKMGQMLGKQDELLDEVRNMNDRLGGKMDQMLDKQDDLIIEVKDVNRKMDRVLETDIVELKSDMAEVKSALRAKGII